MTTVKVGDRVTYKNAFCNWGTGTVIALRRGEGRYASGRMIERGKPVATVMWPHRHGQGKPGQTVEHELRDLTVWTAEELAIVQERGVQ